MRSSASTRLHFSIGQHAPANGAAAVLGSGTLLSASFAPHPSGLNRGQSLPRRKPTLRAGHARDTVERSLRSDRPTRQSVKRFQQAFGDVSFEHGRSVLGTSILRGRL